MIPGDEFLTSNSENLDKIWKRCKKLTTIIVTLDRLATLQQSQSRPSANHQDMRAQKLIRDLICAHPFENGDQTDLKVEKNGSTDRKSVQNDQGLLTFNSLPQAKKYLIEQ